MLAAKLFSLFNNEDQEAPWLQNPWRKDAVVSKKNIMNSGKFCLQSQFACTMTLHQGSSSYITLDGP